MHLKLMRLMRPLSIVLAILGLLLITSGLAYGAYQRVIATPGPAPLPPMLADLSLVEKQSGAEAAQNIAHLHRQTFPLSGAAVGTYGSDSSSATLWVSEYLWARWPHGWSRRWQRRLPPATLPLFRRKPAGWRGERCAC